MAVLDEKIVCPQRLKCVISTRAFTRSPSPGPPSGTTAATPIGGTRHPKTSINSRAAITPAPPGPPAAAPTARSGSSPSLRKAANATVSVPNTNEAMSPPEAAVRIPDEKSTPSLHSVPPPVPAPIGDKIALCTIIAPSNFRKTSPNAAFPPAEAESNIRLPKPPLPSLRAGRFREPSKPS